MGGSVVGLVKRECGCVWVADALGGWLGREGDEVFGEVKMKGARWIRKEKRRRRTRYAEPWGWISRDMLLVNNTHFHFGLRSMKTLGISSLLSYNLIQSNRHGLSY